MLDRRNLLRLMTLAGVGTLVRMPMHALHVVEDPSVSFFVIGDWGTGGSLQRKVAASMAKVAGSVRPSFIVSTGDNIYPDGVSSADDTQWQTKFESIYDHPSLAVPWWAVLGNHDHRSDPDAQIDYHKRNPRWNMPSRYYTHEVPIDAVTSVAMFGLDTQQLVTKADGWKDQLAWLRRSMEASKAAWRVVVGHHPIRSYGHYGDSALLLNTLKPILDDHMTDLYCCGHDHDLQIIRDPADRFVCAVSGGGGGSRPTKRGVHSRYAASNGGFMSVMCDARRMNILAYDANGVQGAVEQLARRTP